MQSTAGILPKSANFRRGNALVALPDALIKIKRRANDFTSSRRASHQINDRLFTWQFFTAAVIMVVIVIAMTTPLDRLSELLSEFTASYTATDTKQNTTSTASPEARLVTLEEALTEAARLARNGERNLAHILYQEVLTQHRSRNVSAAQAAGLLIDVAEFYVDGIEIKPEAIELLFQDAYVTAKRTPEEFGGFERIHLGLEKLYLKHNDFQRAAKQNRLLMDYYRRVYGKRPDERYALEKPVMMRLANNLVSSQRIDDARVVYARLIAQTRKRGQPTDALEALMANVNLPDTGPDRKPDRAINLLKPGADSPGLEQLVRTSLVEGIHIEELQQDSGQVVISGYANSNTTLARYLRQMMNNGAKPELRSVTESVRDGEPVKSFAIVVIKE